MLPQLTSQGGLPPGVHPALLPEVVGRFGKGSARRRELARQLRRIWELAQRSHRLRRAYLWGSFVTAKESPNDLDLMLVMAADFRSELCDMETRKIFDNEIAENEFGATVLWTREDAPPELIQAFLDLWQIGRDGLVRGIVEVMV